MAERFHVGSRVFVITDLQGRTIAARDVTCYRQHFPAHPPDKSLVFSPGNASALEPPSFACGGCGATYTTSAVLYAQTAKSTDTQAPTTNDH